MDNAFPSLSLTMALQKQLSLCRLVRIIVNFMKSALWAVIFDRMAHFGFMLEQFSDIQQNL